MAGKRKFTDEERKERQKEADRRWRENNPEKSKQAQKKWREANAEYERARHAEKYKSLPTEKKKEYSANVWQGLKDNYVRGMLATQTGIPYKEIPQELVEAKRAHILLMRLVKPKQGKKCG